MDKYIKHENGLFFKEYFLESKIIEPLQEEKITYRPFWKISDREDSMGAVLISSQENHTLEQAFEIYFEEFKDYLNSFNYID